MRAAVIGWPTIHPFVRTAEKNTRSASILCARAFVCSPVKPISAMNRIPTRTNPREAAFSSQGHCPFDATEIALRVAMSRKLAATAFHFDIHVDPADVLRSEEHT